jgi:hypothetical protein
MPMDRLKLTLAGFGLVMMLGTTGCRNLRSDVPPGRPLSSDGKSMPSVGFSSDPHPSVGAATGAMATMPGGAPGSTGQYGTPAPGGNGNLGAPTSNAYGPPGSSSLGAGPATAPSYGGDPLAPGPAAPGVPSMPPTGSSLPR